MRRKSFAVGSIVVLAGLLAVAALAQNGMQHQSTAQRTISHINQTDIVNLQGVVTSVNMAPGQGMPSMKLNVGGTEMTIIIGPYRLLADSKFEITPNKEYAVKAFPDPRVANAYVATEILDVAANTSITLRDAAGMPHAGAGGMGMMNGRRGMGAMSGGDPTQIPHAMRGMGGMRGMHAMGDCPNCGNLDLKALTPLTGTVQSVSIEAGQGFPNFTLLAGDGKTYTIMAGPYWLLQQNGFTIAANDRLNVTAYPSLNQPGVFAAATIENPATGRIVKLRGEDGMPLVTGGRGPMHAIRK